MNENKRIENPRIKILKCVGALKMKTRVESLKKKKQQQQRAYFQRKKFSVLELVLTYRRNLSGTWPKSARGKSSSF